MLEPELQKLLTQKSQINAIGTICQVLQFWSNSLSVENRKRDQYF
jgi:hypothetical protein